MKRNTTYDADTIRRLMENGGRFHLCEPCRCPDPAQHPGRPGAAPKCKWDRRAPDKNPCTCPGEHCAWKAPHLDAPGWKKGSAPLSLDKLLDGLDRGLTLGYRPSDFNLGALDFDDGDPTAFLKAHPPLATLASASQCAATPHKLHALYHAADARQTTFYVSDAPPWTVFTPAEARKLAKSNGAAGVISGETRASGAYGYLYLRPGQEDALEAAVEAAAEKPDACPFPAFLAERPAKPKASAQPSLDDQPADDAPRSLSVADQALLDAAAKHPDFIARAPSGWKGPCPLCGTPKHPKGHDRFYVYADPDKPGRLVLQCNQADHSDFTARLAAARTMFGITTPPTVLGPRPKPPQPPFGLDEIEHKLSKRTKTTADLPDTARRLGGWAAWAKKNALDWFTPAGNTTDPTPAPLRAHVVAIVGGSTRSARDTWNTIRAKHRFSPTKPPKKMRRQWKAYRRAAALWEADAKAWDARAKEQRLADARASYHSASIPQDLEPRARPPAPDSIITLPPERSMANVQTCLRHLGFDFRLNARSQRPQVRDARQHAGAGPFTGWFDMTDPIRDRIIDDIALFVAEETDNDQPKSFRWGVDSFRRALSAWGADAIDPFRSYLLGLRHDPNGKSIDHVLHDVFGADKNCPLTTWASRSLFMVPVQRCIPIDGESNTGPGAHVKALTILHGPQSIGKSPFIKHLLPPEAHDSLFSDAFDFAADSKRQLECQLGRVLVECGELTGMFGAALAHLKVAIAKTHLSGVRMAFKEHVVDFPRRDFIVGTSDEVGDFLPADTAGNTRFVVAELKRGSNVEAYLAQHRDQLWANAVHRYLHDGLRAPLPRELAQAQAQANERHRRTDSALEEKLHELGRRLRADNHADVTERWIAVEARVAGRWSFPPREADGHAQEGATRAALEDFPDAPNPGQVWTADTPTRPQSLRLHDALRFTGWTKNKTPQRPRITDPDGRTSQPRSSWSPPPAA